MGSRRPVPDAGSSWDRGRQDPGDSTAGSTSSSSRILRPAAAFAGHRPRRFGSRPSRCRRVLGAAALRLARADHLRFQHRRPGVKSAGRDQVCMALFAVNPLSFGLVQYRKHLRWRPPLKSSSKKARLTPPVGSSGITHGSSQLPACRKAG